MSAKLLGMVLDADLPRPEKFVLAILADHGKEDGTDVYPSVAKIEFKTGYSERQVRDLMTSLQKMGILILLREGGKGAGDTNKYRIAVEKIPVMNFNDWLRKHKGAVFSNGRVQFSPNKGAIPSKQGCEKPQNKGAKIAPELKTNNQEHITLFGNSAAKGAASSPANGKSTEPKPVDPRFQEVVKACKQCWPDGVLFDMGPEDGAAINRMLQRRHRWTSEELEQCVWFRFLSENINPAESIKAWIGAVCDYSTGPRDKFDVPKPDIPYWRRQARKIFYGEEIIAEQIPITAQTPSPLDSVAVRDWKPWKEVIERLETKVNRHSWETWLKPTRGIGFGASGDTYFVQIPSREFSQVGEKYGDLILDAMHFAAPAVQHVEFVCS